MAALANRFANGAKKQIVNEAKAGLSTAGEQLTGTEQTQPQEELRQGQMTAQEYEKYKAEEEGRSRQAISALYAKIEHFRDQREQRSQQYTQNVEQQMQTSVVEQPTEAAPPPSSHPGTQKSHEMLRKKN